MPLITGLEPAAGRATGVVMHVDGQPVCRLSDDLRLRLCVSIGDELTDEQVGRIVHASELAEAKESALRYLSYRPRTRAEVLRHLRGKGLEVHAEAVLGRCEELGYVDDEAYALAFARERIRLRPRGVPRLVSELLSRGVSRDVAERAAVAALEEEDVTEEELLRVVAQRRVRALSGLQSAVARRRLSGFLVRRGFRPGAVRAMVRELLPEEAGEPPG